MSLLCLRSSDPNITIVDQLYDDRSEEGSLYLGSGTPPICSSTSPPPPSHCVVCFDRFIHAVCRDLQKDVKLMMEGAGQHIDLIKSECPGLLGDANTENVGLSGNCGDTWPWWLRILLLLFLLLAVIVIVLLVARSKLRKCRRTPKTLKEGTDAVDSSEMQLV